MLHIKLLLGNELLERLKTASKAALVEKDLDELLSKLNLNKNRQKDRIIYSELNGGDVRKLRYVSFFTNFLSREWKKFADLSTNEEYTLVVETLSAFDEWSKLASKVDLHLTEEHLRRLCCPDEHQGGTCCSTFRLVKYLEKLGGFGSSVKVHMLAQHVGPFAWKHKMLGAVLEEGLEGLHRTLKNDIEKISRGTKLERIRLALLRWAVQVQLSDMEK